MKKEDKMIFDYEINGMKYSVYLVENIDGKEENTIGETDYENQIIRIKRGKDNVMLRTLKHELTHTWLYEYGHYQHEKEFTNEDVCEIVACINDFINKEVDRWEKSVKFN